MSSLKLDHGLRQRYQLKENPICGRLARKRHERELMGPVLGVEV